MNLGECPYDDCRHFAIYELPDRPLPTYARLECEGCKRPLWYRFSRADPTAWTEADFLAEFEIDESTMRITPRSAAE